MNFVDEQHVPRFEIGQQGRKITGALQHRAGGLPQVHAEFLGKNVRERGLAESRRSVDQDVIQRLVAAAGGRNEYLHLFANHGLSDIVRKPFGPDLVLDARLVTGGGRRNEAILVHRTARLSASRMICSAVMSSLYTESVSFCASGAR